MKEYLKQLCYNLYVLFFLSKPKETKSKMNIPDNYPDAESEIDECSVCGRYDWIDVLRNIKGTCFCPKCYYTHKIKEWFKVQWFYFFFVLTCILSLILAIITFEGGVKIFFIVEVIFYTFFVIYTELKDDYIYNGYSKHETNNEI